MRRIMTTASLIVMAAGLNPLIAQQARNWVGAVHQGTVEGDGTTPVARDASGAILPVQPLGDDWYAFLLPAAQDPETPYTVRRLHPFVAPPTLVQASLAEDRLAIAVHGRPFTEYRFRDGARPYFFPVLDRDGASLSRHWPMAEKDGEAQDHPHHRSLWFSYGDVNGHDLWAENGRHGSIRHVGFEEVVSGPVFGGFTAVCEWLDPDGEVLCKDRRTLRVYGTDDVLLFDLVVALSAVDAPVTFGDTKEGMMGWRVPATLRLKGGVGEGHIVNSAGDRDGDTWGKRAAWCDYHGPVEGKVRGIAMFDHPDNLRHPTWWHVRDYGLFAANPFGVHYFEGAPEGAGDHELAVGQPLVFRYRFLVHPGDEVVGGVKAQYESWAGFRRGS